MSKIERRQTVSWGLTCDKKRSNDDDALLTQETCFESPCAGTQIVTLKCAVTIFDPVK